MDERQKLQKLFVFDLWSTHKLVDVCREQSPFEEEEACVSLLSHVINAQKIWFSRVVEISADRDLDIWTKYDSGELKRKAKKANQAWIDLIGDHEVDLDNLVKYKNSKGAEYYNSIWEICNHLIIHGQHHRAQIALFLKNSGIEPPLLDYAHYTRTDTIRQKMVQNG